MQEKTEKEIMANWKADEKPLVSICSITYNHGKFIAKSLDSILMQETNFPFEIIIRDDCSTDNTATIVREYAEKFPHIISTVLETENQYSKGVRGSIVLYQKVVGKYVAMLEGDDYWRDKLKLQKQVDFLDENSDYAVSYCNSIVVDENDKLVSKTRYSLPKEYSSEQMLLTEAYIPTNTAMFRKVLTLSPEKFNNTLSVDTLLWHLLGHHGKSKYQENIISSAYRVHSGGVYSSLEEIEKFKNGMKIKQQLIKLSQDDSKLQSKLRKVMNRTAAIWLNNATTSLDFKFLQSIIKEITHNEDLSLFRITTMLPKVWLQKIRRKLS